MFTCTCSWQNFKDAFWNLNRPYCYCCGCWQPGPFWKARWASARPQSWARNGVCLHCIAYPSPWPIQLINTITGNVPRYATAATGIFEPECKYKIIAHNHINQHSNIRVSFNVSLFIARR